MSNPASQIVVDLIETEKWFSMEADVKGDIHEGRLAKSADESLRGAGQCLTPRQLITGIVKVISSRRMIRSVEQRAVRAAFCSEHRIL